MNKHDRREAGAIAAALAFLVLAATTVHATEASDVRVAKHPADVAGCMVVGQFTSTGKFWALAKDLKRQAAAAGADTIIISQNNPLAIASLDAVGYKCQTSPK